MRGMTGGSEGGLVICRGPWTAHAAGPHSSDSTICFASGDVRVSISGYDWLVSSESCITDSALPITGSRHRDLVVRMDGIPNFTGGSSG